MFRAVPTGPLIGPKIDSLFGVWDSGFTASRALMTYGVEKAMPRDEFMMMAEAQIPLLRHINEEIGLFRKDGWNAVPGSDCGRALNAQELDTLNIYEHNVSSRELKLLTMVEMAKASPRILDKWHEKSKTEYSLNPGLSYLIAQVRRELSVEMVEKRAHIWNRISIDPRFKNDHLLGAKIIFRNLMSNSLKYGPDGVGLDIWNEGITLYFRDTGFGMDPEFASKLGKGVRIREGRVADVDGSGIGWESIGKITGELGWQWTVESFPGEGTLVQLTMSESSFMDSAEVFLGLNLASKLSAEEILKQVNQTFQGAKPFAGFKPVSGGIDISDSPIYRSVRAAQNVWK